MNSGCEYEDSNSSAWEPWFRRNTPAMVLFARQFTASEAEAQDLVQEALVESWRRQGSKGPPAIPLVYATIRRRAVDAARQKTRRENRERSTTNVESAAWFDLSSADAERSSILQQAVQQLPNLYREVIVMKIWGGLTFAEIGETLGIPLNTAGSRYRYGLAELRKLTRNIEA